MMISDTICRMGSPERLCSRLTTNSASGDNRTTPVLVSGTRVFSTMVLVAMFDFSFRIPYNKGVFVSAFRLTRRSRRCRLRGRLSFGALRSRNFQITHHKDNVTTRMSTHSPPIAKYPRDRYAIGSNQRAAIRPGKMARDRLISHRGSLTAHLLPLTSADPVEPRTLCSR